MSDPDLLPPPTDDDVGLHGEHLRLLLQGPPALLRSALDDAHDADIAAAAGDLDDAEAWSLLTTLEPEYAGQVLAHLPHERQAALARDNEPDAVADLLEAMSSDDRADLVQALDDTTRGQVLGQMQAAERADAEHLAEYADGTAGSVMSTDFVTLDERLTVTQAVDRLRELAARKETIYYNYVTDDAGLLHGVVSLRDLVLDAPATPVGEVMSRDFKFVRADDDIDDVSEKVRAYDLLALPVLDADGRIVGIITVDDVMDAAEREVTEDFERIGGVAAVGKRFGQASLGLLYRKRVPWLLVLVFVNILSGEGIAAFEETIAANLSLIFFLPLLIASGGNAGSQSATLMIRSLATGEVETRDWLRLLGREIVMALALGGSMAAAVSIVAGFRAPEVLAVVAVSMVVIVTFGSLMGMILPFIFERLKIDPATASGPLVTSLADVAGVLVYLAIAHALLGGPTG